jgi:hypothetical protein
MRSCNYPVLAVDMSVANRQHAMLERELCSSEQGPVATRVCRFQAPLIVTFTTQYITYTSQLHLYHNKLDRLQPC